MKQLRNLSIPIAIHAFMMNMPEMVYILRNFQSVRNVTLSWGSSEENYTYSGNRILYMMRWLSNALVCENANINVQLCFSVHQDIYVREIWITFFINRKIWNKRIESISLENQNHIQGLPNLKNIGTIVITTGYGMTDYWINMKHLVKYLELT